MPATSIHTHTWLCYKQICHPDSSQTQHTLRHHHLNHVHMSILRSFIYIPVLHLHTEISISLSFRVKSLGRTENTKQSFDCTSAHIRNPAAPPLGLLCLLRWLSKKNKCESKEVYKQEANRKRSGDVLEDTLLGGMTWARSRLSLEQTYAPSLICLRLICLPFKNISSITSRATAPRVLWLLLCRKTKAFQLCVFCL